MSDLAATNCGCNNDRGDCGCGCNNSFGCGNNFFPGFSGNTSSCSCILWIIILMCLCGNNGCGNSFSTNNGDCCWLIILLLLLCNGCGTGC